MALIICPKCGKQYSSHLPQCPDCGLPQGDIQSYIEEQKRIRREKFVQWWNNRGKKLSVIIGLVILAIVLGKVVYVICMETKASTEIQLGDSCMKEENYEVAMEHYSKAESLAIKEATINSVCEKKQQLGKAMINEADKCFIDTEYDAALNLYNASINFFGEEDNVRKKIAKCERCRQFAMLASKADSLNDTLSAVFYYRQLQIINACEIYAKKMSLWQNKSLIQDICGNTYPIVKIGKQVWMSENMRCNMYDTESEAYNAPWLTNSTIPTSEWRSYNPYYTDASRYAFYLSNGQIAKLGYLYNWAAAVGVENGLEQETAFFSSRQGICPNGWHVPSRKEWQTLYDYIYNTQKLSSDAVGKYLKTTSGWDDDGNGFDIYVFAALPAGCARGSSVDDEGGYTYFWSATPSESYSCDAYYRYLYYFNDYLRENDSYKNYGRSVRCLRD